MKSLVMKNTIKALPHFILILLFVYAAVSKWLDLAAFRHQMRNQTFPHWLADILVYALPLFELITVALLFSAKTQLKGLWLSLILLLAFTGYILLVLFQFWDRVPCSCGGILSQMSWTTHLIFNLVMLTINVIALSGALKEEDHLPKDLAVS